MNKFDWKIAKVGIYGKELVITAFFCNLVYTGWQECWIVDMCFVNVEVLYNYPITYLVLCAFSHGFALTYDFGVG